MPRGQYDRRAVRRRPDHGGVGDVDATPTPEPSPAAAEEIVRNPLDRLRDVLDAAVADGKGRILPDGRYEFFWPMPEPYVAEPDGAAESDDLPQSVRLLRDHGYVEQVHNKGVFHWSAGEVVTNPATIAHLMERGAELEPVECLDPPAIPPTH